MWDVASMSKDQVQRPMAEPLTYLSFVYEAEGDNATIFTARAAKALKQVEATITGVVGVREMPRAALVVCMCMGVVSHERVRVHACLYQPRYKSVVCCVCVRSPILMRARVCVCMCVRVF